MTARLRVLFVLAAGLLGACAPVAPPRPVPVPPAETPEPTVPTPAPVPTAPSLPPYTLDGEPAIDVGLRWNADSLSVVPVETVAIHLSRNGELNTVGRTRAVVRTSRTAGGVRVRSDAGTFDLSPGDTLWVGGDPIDGERSARMKWNGKSWRGTFKLFVGSRGGVTLASRMPLEAYLLGVIPGEIGGLSESLMEAGRAQAIAARSFTLYYLGRRWKEGFDLFSTVDDQVYGPVDSERPLASEVVVTTRARVALSEEQPIRANYSSTCGGMTADVWEAWPTEPRPYLVSTRDGQEGADFCRESRHYRWVEHFTAAEWQQNMRRWCPERGVPLPKGGVGDLLDVRVAERSRSGRAWNLEVITTTGLIVIPAHELRWVVRRAGQTGSILRSTFIKVDVKRDPRTRKALGVVVSGAGAGHGVGLCQTGALGMSRAGISAEDILTHYYRGTEIRTLY